MVLIRTEYDFCPGVKDIDSFFPKKVFNFIVAYWFIWKIGWRRSCLEVSSWDAWYSFWSFILTIRERSFPGLSSWFIWINLTTPALIMKSWKIKIHFEIFDQNEILILFEPNESVISSPSRSQSGNPMNHPPPFGAKPKPMNQLVSCHIGINPNTW